MNGPQHYREAERLLELAESVDWQPGDASRPDQSNYASVVLACAQVHATLAVTAATAAPQVDLYLDNETHQAGAWTAVIEG